MKRCAWRSPTPKLEAELLGPPRLVDDVGEGLLLRPAPTRHGSGACRAACRSRTSCRRSLARRDGEVEPVFAGGAGQVP